MWRKWKRSSWLQVHGDAHHCGVLGCMETALLHTGRLQEPVKSTKKLISSSLSLTADIYISRSSNRAASIMKDSSSSAHALFMPFHSGRRLCVQNIQAEKQLLPGSYQTYKLLYYIYQCPHAV